MRKPGRVSRQIFTIGECRVCRFVFVNPRIADDQIAGLYDEAYYRGDGFDATIGYAADSPPPGVLESNAAVVETVREAVGGSLANLRTLDVGCGAGLLAEAFATAGTEAHGQDTSPSAIALSRRRITKIHQQPVDELEAAGERFSVITAVEVIEHVPYPTEFVRRLHALLAPGGILLLATGNWNLVRQLPGTPYIMPEGHLAYYTPATLDRLFRNAGFEARSKALNRTWAGFRVLARLGLGESPIPRIAATIATSVTRGLGPFPIAVA